MNNESPISPLAVEPPARGRSTACSPGHQLPAPTTEEEMNALRAMRHVGYGGPFDTAYQLEDHETSVTANPEKYYGNVYNTVFAHVDRKSEGTPQRYIMNEKKSTKDFIKANLASEFGLLDENGGLQPTNAQAAVFNPFYLHDKNLFPFDLEDLDQNYRELIDGNSTMNYPFTNCRRCQRICVQYKKQKHYCDIKEITEFESEAPIDPCASSIPGGLSDFSEECYDASGGAYTCQYPGTSQCYEAKWSGGNCAMTDRDITDERPLCPNSISLCAGQPGEPSTYSRTCDIVTGGRNTCMAPGTSRCYGSIRRSGGCTLNATDVDMLTPLCDPCSGNTGEPSDYSSDCDIASDGKFTCLYPGTSRCFAMKWEGGACSMEVEDADEDHPLCKNPCASPSGSDYSADCDAASNGNYTCLYPGTTRCFAEKWGGGACALTEKWADGGHPLCGNSPSICGSDYSEACDDASDGKYQCQYPGTQRCFETKWDGGRCSLTPADADSNHPLCDPCASPAGIPSDYSAECDAATDGMMTCQYPGTSRCFAKKWEGGACSMTPQEADSNHPLCGGPCASPPGYPSDYSVECDNASDGKYTCQYPGTSRCFERKWGGGVCAMEADDADDNHPLCDPCSSPDGMASDYSADCDRLTLGKFKCLYPGTSRCFAEKWGGGACAMTAADADAAHPICDPCAQDGNASAYSAECDAITGGQMTCQYPGTSRCFAEKWGGDKCAMKAADSDANHPLCDPCSSPDGGTDYSEDCSNKSDGRYKCQYPGTNRCFARKWTGGACSMTAAEADALHPLCEAPCAHGAALGLTPGPTDYDEECDEASGGMFTCRYPGTDRCFEMKWDGGRCSLHAEGADAHLPLCSNACSSPAGYPSDFSQECVDASNGESACLYPGTTRCFETKWSGAACSMTDRFADENHPLCPNVVSPCADGCPDGTGSCDYSLECDIASGGEKTCLYPGTERCFATKWDGPACSLTDTDPDVSQCSVSSSDTTGNRRRRSAPYVPACFEAAKRTCENMNYKLPTPKSQEQADELYRLIQDDFSEYAHNDYEDNGSQYSTFSGGFYLGFQETVVDEDTGETSWVDVYTNEPVNFFDWGPKQGLVNGQYYYDYSPPERPADLTANPIYMAVNPQFNGWAVRPGEMQTDGIDCTAPSQFNGNEPWCKACGENGEGCAHYCVDECVSIPDPIIPEVCPVVMNVGAANNWSVYVWKQYFTRYTAVLDGAFEVYADSGVSDETIMFVAKVAMHYLDSDGDGVVDNDIVAKNLKDHMAHIIIYSDIDTFWRYQQHLGPWENKDGLQDEFETMMRWVQALHVKDINQLAPGSASDKTVDYVLQHIYMFGLYQNRDEYGISNNYLDAHSCIDGIDTDCTTEDNYPQMFKSKNTVPAPKRLMQFYSAVVRSYQGLLGNKCRGELNLKFEDNRLEYDHDWEVPDSEAALDQSYLWSGCDIENIYNDDGSTTPVTELKEMMTCSGAWDAKDGCLVIPKQQMKPYTTVNSDCFPTWIPAPVPPINDDGDDTDSCDNGLDNTPEIAILIAADPNLGWKCFEVSNWVEHQFIQGYANKVIHVMQGYFKVYAQDSVSNDKMKYVAAVAAAIIDGHKSKGNDP